MNTTLTGKLLFAGDLAVNGEKITGIAIGIDRDTLRDVERLPLYDNVAVIFPGKLEELQRINVRRQIAQHTKEKLESAHDPILTDEVLSAHRLPIPVSIMADLCNTAPKGARCEQRGDWFVILQPA